MDSISTEYLKKCIDTLEKSYEMIKTAKEGTVEYEMFRNSLVKGFEMTLEQCGNLLKKKLVPYFATKKQADSLYFKDIFRYALKHSLLDEESVNRWMIYRDNRNNTAHNYGVEFANETLGLMDSFLADAKNLKKVLDDE